MMGEDQRFLHQIRHGIPKVRYPRRWLISAGEMNAAMDAYDSAGLDVSKIGTLPAPIDGMVASSDLPRAIETAELLCGRSREHILTSELFREVPIPRFKRHRVYLPAILFYLIARLGWYTGWMEGTESYLQTRDRILRGADLLDELFREQRAITLVSHDFVLRLLGWELHRRGWSRPRLRPFGFLEQRTQVYPLSTN